MTGPQQSPVSDRGVVLREYATEDRFLARRLAAWAELDGPLVEDAAIEALAEGKPARLLEVGCGTGDHTERVRRELGAELTALDLSRRMAELTQARGLPAIQADIEALPFRDGAFGCVLANRVLYHVQDLSTGLREIARVLRPGGRLVAVTYSNHHLSEFNEVLGVALRPTPFSAENGAELLAAVFDSVERRDYSGLARFASTDDMRAFLAAYGEFAEVDLAARLGEVATPFVATYRHSIFIAQTTP